MGLESLGVVNLPTFLLGTLIVILLPGPNSLLIVSTVARGGVRSGYLAAGGIVLGDLVLITLAAAGLASVLLANPAVFAVLRIAGGAYLGLIGLGLLREAWRRAQQSGTDAVPATPNVTQVQRPLRSALLTSLTNPKAILFLMAFFIQFIDRRYPHPALSFAVLGLCTQVMSIVYLNLLIHGSARLVEMFRRQRRLAVVLNGCAGALFLGFGARIAAATAH